MGHSLTSDDAARDFVDHQIIDISDLGVVGAVHVGGFHIRAGDQLVVRRCTSATSPSLRRLLAFATRGLSSVPLMMVSRSSSGDDFCVMRPHISKDVRRVAIADNVARPAAYQHPNTKVSFWTADRKREAKKPKDKRHDDLVLGSSNQGRGI
jgi:hypothetical protein